jgi:hypothetical protein
VSTRHGDFKGAQFVGLQPRGVNGLTERREYDVLLGTVTVTWSWTPLLPEQCGRSVCTSSVAEQLQFASVLQVLGRCATKSSLATWRSKPAAQDHGFPTPHDTRGKEQGHSENVDDYAIICFLGNSRDAAPVDCKADQRCFAVSVATQRKGDSDSFDKLHVSRGIPPEHRGLTSDEQSHARRRPALLPLNWQDTTTFHLERFPRTELRKKLEAACTPQFMRWFLAAGSRTSWRSPSS